MPDIPTAIAAVISTYSDAQRVAFATIRDLVFEVAAQNPSIGPLTETLKWNEPAYLTQTTKSGSTLRLAGKSKTPNHLGLYMNCKTSLIETLRDIYPDTFTFQGNRAALVNLNAPLPMDAIAHAIDLTLTYHLKRP